MRLRTIRFKLEQVIPELIVNANKRNSQPPTHQLLNAEELKDAVKALKELHLFPDLIDGLEKLSFFTFNGDTLVISQQEFIQLNKIIPQLEITSKSLSSSIELAQNHKVNNDLTVSIKIPEVNDFEELEKISSKLSKIFSQTLLTKEIKGSFRVVGFDSGSNWIDILASSVAIVQTIGGLAYSGAIVFKKLQEGFLVQQKVKEMKISNSAISEIIERSKEEVNDVAEKEANYIYEKFFSGKDEEQIARIKMSLKEIADLYQQGGTIKPSLEASNEVEEEFPKMDELQKLESRIKKIEQKQKKKK